MIYCMKRVSNRPVWREAKAKADARKAKARAEVFDAPKAVPKDEPETLVKVTEKDPTVQDPRPEDTMLTKLVKPFEVTRTSLSITKRRVRSALCATIVMPLVV